MHDLARGNGPHLIQRLTRRIAMQRTNVDALMKTGVNDATRYLSRVADKPILPSLPRFRFHSIEIAFHILVKSSTITREQRVIVRGQNQIEGLTLGGLRHYSRKRQDTEQSGGTNSSHDGLTRLTLTLSHQAPVFFHQINIRGGQSRRNVDFPI